MAPTSSTPATKAEKLFQRFYTDESASSICTGRGPCYWIFDEATHTYIPDPDHPNTCGGTCHCDPPGSLTYVLRQELGLEYLSVQTDCMGPGRMGPTKEQIEILIELLREVRRLKWVVVALAATAVVLLAAMVYFMMR